MVKCINIYFLQFSNVANFRAQKRLPLTNPLLGLAMQFVAMTILIISKLFGIAILLMKAPYYLPICMALEFLIVLVMDCILHKTINGNYFSIFSIDLLVILHC